MQPRGKPPPLYRKMRGGIADPPWPLPGRQACSRDRRSSSPPSCLGHGRVLGNPRRGNGADDWGIERCASSERASVPAEDDGREDERRPGPGPSRGTPDGGVRPLRGNGIERDGERTPIWEASGHHVLIRAPVAVAMEFPGTSAVLERRAAAMSPAGTLRAGILVPPSLRRVAPLPARARKGSAGGLHPDGGGGPRRGGGRGPWRGPRRRSAWRAHHAHSERRRLRRGASRCRALRSRRARCDAAGRIFRGCRTDPLRTTLVPLSGFSPTLLVPDLGAVPAEAAIRLGDPRAGRSRRADRSRPPVGADPVIVDMLSDRSAALGEPAWARGRPRCRTCRGSCRRPFGCSRFGLAERRLGRLARGLRRALGRGAAGPPVWWNR